ncbi:MAG: right-handed parallel beta-helix repeat-containing protein [Actinomycetota bacterium]|nr:right-handed parallel beta-helix repeat-containing protein [Actinomycetota bacterium]
MFSGNPRGKRLLVGALGVAAGLALPTSASAGITNVTVNDDDTGTGPEGANCATAQFQSIQAAVTVAAPGDTILVCSGTYNETVTINKDELTLRGAQAGNDARSRSGEESTITGGGVSINAMDVEFDGFTVEDANDPSVGSGINTNGASGVRILNNIIRSNTFGLSLSNPGGDQAIVRKNLFADNNDPGSASGNGIYSDTGASNVLIEENRFTGHDNGSILFVGGDQSTQRGIDILDNRIVNDSAILLFAVSGATVNGNRISGSNLVDDDGDPGTPEQDAASSVFFASVQGASVKRNRITGEPNSAVRIGSFGTGPSEDISIVGNTLVNNGFGVRATDDGADGPIRIEFNRIFRNDTGVANEDATQDASDPRFDAENNWWGCNEGANEDGCDTTTGNNIDDEPHLVLTLRVGETTLRSGETTKVRADLRRNSEGENFGKRSLFPDGTKIRFGAEFPDGDRQSTVTPRSDRTFQALASTTFRARGKDNGGVFARLDAETVKQNIRIKRKRR